MRRQFHGETNKWSREVTSLEVPPTRFLPPAALQAMQTLSRIRGLPDYCSIQG